MNRLNGLLLLLLVLLLVLSRRLKRRVKFQGRENCHNRLLSLYVRVCHTNEKEGNLLRVRMETAEQTNKQTKQ